MTKLSKFEPGDRVIMNGVYVTIIGNYPGEPGALLVKNDKDVLIKTYPTKLDYLDKELEKEFEEVKDKIAEAVRLLDLANDLARSRKTSLNIIAEKLAQPNYAKDLDKMYELIVNGSWRQSTYECREGAPDDSY
jgi:hypothetical protein